MNPSEKDNSSEKNNDGKININLIEPSNNEHIEIYTPTSKINQNLDENKNDK